MKLEVEHLGAVQFEIKTRNHVIICDQPEEAGGFDEGVTPPELLLASLGSCAAYYAAQYLRKNKLATEGTKVRISAEKVPNPARMDKFVIEIDCPVELSDAHRTGVEKEVQKCLIHNTLMHPPSITLDIQSNAL